MPSARKLTAVPPTIWSARRWIAKTRRKARANRPTRHRRPGTRPPTTALVGAVDAPEGAHQHHPLETDVHDAAALGEHAAERAEDERRRERERLRDQRGVEDGLRFPTPDRVASMPSPSPSTPAAIAPQPRRRAAARDRPDAEHATASDADERSATIERARLRSAGSRGTPRRRRATMPAKPACAGLRGARSAGCRAPAQCVMRGRLPRWRFGRSFRRVFQM